MDDKLKYTLATYFGIEEEDEEEDEEEEVDEDE